jgi:uncharacterized BrkB/YihY/UPF0761 family membrane protein
VVWDLSIGIGSPVSVNPRTPDGYTAALRRFYELETAVHPSFFRRKGAGWVLLNILIGAVMSFGLFFLAVLAAISTRGDFLEGSREPSDDAFGSSFLITLLAGVIGWLLFCYLRSPRARGIWLAALYVGAVVAGTAILATSVGPPVD